MNRSWLGMVVVLTLGACGGAAEQTDSGEGTATDATSGGNAPAPSEITGPPRPWEEMSFDDRRQYMVDEVLPRMAPLFEEHDAERYAGFSCDGCHGADMRDRNFEMPNPGILALHPTGTEEQEQMVRDHPETVRFMFNHVLPTMQQLLDAPDFNAETGVGWSCYGCHTSGESAAE